MQNNQIKIIIEDGPEVTFRFSHIVGLNYSEKGFHAVVDMDGQRVNIPISARAFGDAVVWIKENVKHCKECGHGLTKECVLAGNKILFTSYKCPKCEGHGID